MENTFSPVLSVLQHWKLHTRAREQIRNMLGQHSGFIDATILYRYNAATRRLSRVEAISQKSDHRSAREEQIARIRDPCLLN